MWASMFSCTSQTILVKPLSNRTHCASLKLRASLSDYPLASRIMVRNLSFSTHESRLQKEFSNFGEIAEVKLVKDELTKKSKGYAFIQYTSQDDALIALENMDRQSLDGRLIYVDIAKPGKEAFRGYPKTSGPPKKQQVPEQDEVADCWY
ncbi:RNA-binding protein 3 [Mangifera indica]|uniref:RNA-binding protein 3 n=1 Tax=Mangifera indica TaxID=29780 RepID=UPI001CF9DF12|nr:RNA-binding protein 3 [Mangifera indica]